MDLIATRYKEKLPRGFSYAVGAEVLSAALESVPQYDDLGFLFQWRDSYRAAAYQKKLNAKGKILVVGADYSRLFESWWIKIAAVPSGHRDKVRSLLQDSILDRLKEALLASPGHPEYFWWQARYDLEVETIAITGAARPKLTSHQY